MQSHTLRNLTGILVAAAVLTAYAVLVLTRAPPPLGHVAATLLASTQLLKVAQTEKFQTDLQFAESNAEAARLVGNQIKLGRIEGADPVVELNVREGGVIEYLLDKKDNDGKPLRVIYLPQVGDPVGSQAIDWQCYSANWSGVTKLASHCRFDTTAWEMERRHVAGLRAAAGKSGRDAERSLAKFDADHARDDFERQSAQLQRESERAREDEEKQLARIERETERARIEYERQKRGW